MTETNSTIGCTTSMTQERSGTSPPFLCLICVCLCLFLPALLFAEEANVVEWRRVFAPFEKINDLAVEWSIWSVPMPRQEFEDLIEQFERRADEQSTTHLHLSKIVLRAKLDGRQRAVLRTILQLYYKWVGIVLFSLRTLRPIYF